MNPADNPAEKWPADDWIDNIERAIAREGELPEAGFPEAILRSAETLHISTDFVGTCLAAVQADQARIQSEAARVEQTQFPEELLAAFSLPRTSPEFVDRTLQMVQADRHAQRAEWRQILRSYRIPKPSRDFVERTFTALASASAGPVLAGPVLAGPVSWRRRVAAAAAAVLLAVGLNFALLGSDQTDLVYSASSAQDFSPVPWGTALERQSILGLSFEAIDGLQVLSLAQRAEDD